MASVGQTDTRQVKTPGVSKASTQPLDEDTKKRREWNKKAKWVTENIEMRICSYYIASTKRVGMCRCGYSKQIHEAFARPSQEQPSVEDTLNWPSEKYSVTAPTNAFGEIESFGFKGNNAKFIRVDSKTEITTMLKLMTDVWELKIPSLIISVIGGTDNFNITPKLRDMFRLGLVNFARKTDAWIITEGIHSGVPKHVGEAVKNSHSTSKNQKDVVTIGIAPWGGIQDKHLLEHIKSEPIEYTIEDKDNEGEIYLTPNHSHYILVDNGSQYKFKTETELRTELELKTGLEKDSKPVPVVLLVIDGATSILNRVKNALSNDIPVVIVKDSGRIADVLEYAFENAETITKTKKVLKSAQKQYVSDLLKDTKVCEEKEIPNNIKVIDACLEKFELINILEWGSDDQVFHNTIFGALLSAKKGDIVEQLRVALSLNLVDYARSNILTVDNGLKPGSLCDIMMSSIASHKADHVELLLDNGVDMKECLTTERLLRLYNDEFRSKGTFSTLLRNLGEEINTEPNKELSMNDVETLIKNLLDNNYLLQYNSCTEGNNLPVKAERFENPFLHLLIWAVLNNLQDMAKLFWKNGLDSIAAALLARALLSAMASKLNNASHNQYEDIKANSCEFMNLAIGVLEQCNRANENYTRDLLMGDLLELQRASCILIAMKTKNQTFICATASQKVFNNVWMGEMTQENGILRLLICMFIPPLIPLCVKFKENKDNKPDAGSGKASETVKEDPQPGESCPSDPLLEGPPSHEKNHGDEPKSSRGAMEKIQLFYKAPVAKFLSHVISYMAFLCLYSYILVSKFDQILSAEDIILIAWVVNIFIEEIRQVFATRHIYNEIKLTVYLADFWNIGDILLISLFVIGMILKYLPYQDKLEAARVVHGINLIICFLRLLQMFSLSKELGPKLVMINRMVRKLSSFFVMLLIFIVAYAIASHAILYPDTEISFNVLRVIFRRPYWNIFGDLMLDEIEGTSDCTNIVELYRNGTHPRCPSESGKHVVPVLMGVYMLICNILLLNLLISIFSYTYQKVQDKADKHWRIQRYHQIQDYLARSNFIPLISMIMDVYNILKPYLCSSEKGKSTSEKNIFFVEVFPSGYRLKVRKWESNIAQDFIKSKQADLESIDNSIKAITLRLDQLFSKMDALEMRCLRNSTTSEYVLYKPSKTCRIVEP